MKQLEEKYTNIDSGNQQKPASTWDPMTCPACWSPLKDTGIVVQAVVPKKKKIVCTNCTYLRYDSI